MTDDKTDAEDKEGRTSAYNVRWPSVRSEMSQQHIGSNSLSCCQGPLWQQLSIGAIENIDVSETKGMASGTLKT